MGYHQKLQNDQAREPQVLRWKNDQKFVDLPLADGCTSGHAIISFADEDQQPAELAPLPWPHQRTC